MTGSKDCRPPLRPALARCRSPGSDDGPLVTALARLYAYLYNTDEAAVRPAAQHRARAMDISDRWVHGGREPGSPLIAEERDELIRSYAALLAALHRLAALGHRLR